mmetsp:Transcript_6782/g.21899  ORF Transcript_6782/g.21899 Transcript_6782/m.21899 type:complete len:355 (-) Transcript_6782:737-1801(-)
MFHRGFGHGSCRMHVSRRQAVLLQRGREDPRLARGQEAARRQRRHKFLLRVDHGGPLVGGQRFKDRPPPPLQCGRRRLRQDLAPARLGRAAVGVTHDVFKGSFALLHEHGEALFHKERRPLRLSRSRGHGGRHAARLTVLAQAAVAPGRGVAADFGRGGVSQSARHGSRLRVQKRLLRVGDGLYCGLPRRRGHGGPGHFGSDCQGAGADGVWERRCRVPARHFNRSRRQARPVFAARGALGPVIFFSSARRRGDGVLCRRRRFLFCGAGYGRGFLEEAKGRRPGRRRRPRRRRRRHRAPRRRGTTAEQGGKADAGVRPRARDPQGAGDCVCNFQRLSFHCRCRRLRRRLARGQV